MYHSLRSKITITALPVYMCCCVMLPFKKITLQMVHLQSEYNQQNIVLGWIFICSLQMCFCNLVKVAVPFSSSRVACMKACVCTYIPKRSRVSKTFINSTQWGNTDRCLIYTETHAEDFLNVVYLGYVLAFGFQKRFLWKATSLFKGPDKAVVANERRGT